MDTDTHTLTRTVTYKLDLQPSVVSELSYHWSELCNYISRIAYHDKIYNLKLLYARAYGPAREMSPLPAYYVVSAIRHVLARYATVRSNKHVIHKPLFFKPNGAIPLVLGNTISYLDSGISIATHNGRIKGIRTHNGMWVDKYKDWKRGSATVYVKNGEVYLGVVIQKEVEAHTNDGVIGVDLGIRNIATVTDGNHNNVFYSGKSAWKKKNRFACTRASLQRKKAQRGRTGSRSVRRVLRRLSGREARYMKDVNHIVSKDIVSKARAWNTGTVVFENLSGVREGSNKKGKRLRKSVNQWSYYQLQQFVSYKAEEYGIRTANVDPKYTSQLCSRCGEIGNRNGNSFSCSCGYTLHADLNGARNIRARQMDKVCLIAGSKSLSPEVPLLADHRYTCGTSIGSVRLESLQ